MTVKAEAAASSVRITVFRFPPMFEVEVNTESTLQGGTDRQIDLTNPDNLGRQSTDSGIVPNLKWRFSDSKVRLFNRGLASRASYPGPPPEP